MHVSRLPRYVEIAAHDELLARLFGMRGVRIELGQEHLLRCEVFAAVWYVRRNQDQTVQLSGHNARLVVEARVVELDGLGGKAARDVKRDTRVAFVAVPHAEVVRHPHEGSRHVLARGLDLLKAEHLRLLLREQLEDLGPASADSIDVPGDDREHSRPRRVWVVPDAPSSGQAIPRRVGPHLAEHGATEVSHMSASQIRRASSDRAQTADAASTIAGALAKPSDSDNATPALFVTSETPHREDCEETASMTLTNDQWNRFWTAADSGELATEQGPDDQVDSADTGFLTGLMLERFDDDERWRELSRTGRAL